MTFVLEDGTGLADANSYGSFAGYVAYWADRGVTVTELQAVVEPALVRATDYLDQRYPWKGSRLTSEQALQWPRACAYGEPTFEAPCGVTLDGVPAQVVRACYELASRAISADLAPDPTVDASGQTVVSSRKKVGPIEVETAFNGGGSSPWVKSYPEVDAILRYAVERATKGVYRA